MKIKHDGIVWVTLLVIAIGVLVGYWALVAKYTSYFSGQVALATEPNEEVCMNPNEPVGLTGAYWPTDCYGLSIEFDDFNHLKNWFDDSICDNKYEVYIRVGEFEKTYNFEEFFARLGLVEPNEPPLR